MCAGERKQMVSIKERNRRDIKNILKTSYFLVKKNGLYIQENFTDIVDFFKDLDDKDIVKHLKGSSSCATYTSKTSAEEFVQHIRDYLEEGFKDHLLTASEFSLMADETTNISGQAELSIFVYYVDSDIHKINEEFLGMVEVIDSKGAKALFILICEVLANKATDIIKMRFNSMDETNTMNGECSGLQGRFSTKFPMQNA